METVLTVLIILTMILAVVAGAAIPSVAWFLSKGKETRSTIVAFLIFSALIIGVLNNGLNLMNVNSFWQYVVKGVVILGAVYVDFLRNKNKK